MMVRATVSVRARVRVIGGVTVVAMISNKQGDEMTQGLVWTFFTAM